MRRSPLSNCTSPAGKGFADPVHAPGRCAHSERWFREADHRWTADRATCVFRGQYT